MSFCSPTTGRSRPNTLASNRTPCCAFAIIRKERTEQTPKWQPLAQRRADYQPAFSRRPHEEIRIAFIVGYPQRVQSGDGAVDQGDLRFVEGVRTRHEVHVAHVAPAANGE